MTKKKSTNTFQFKKFGEKVKGLRVSARKFLLQKAHTEDGEDVSIFHQTLTKHQDLNLTEAFQAFQEELGKNVQTTAQVVYGEQHIARCLATHLSVKDSPALQPLLDLLVAFANDLPKDFHDNHLYTFMPKLVAQLSTKEPEQVESVFLCIVSLFVVLQKYLRDNLYDLYHTHNYAKLLSSEHKGYIHELASQSLAYLLRKVPNKENFLKLAFRKLKKDESQVEGVGRLIGALMKSDVVQRLHSCTGDVLRICLELLGSEGIDVNLSLKAILYGIGITANYVVPTNSNKKGWQEHWKEDSVMVWPTLWNRVRFLLENVEKPETDKQLLSVLQIILRLVKHKKCGLVTDKEDALGICISTIQSPVSDKVGVLVCNIMTYLISSHQIPVTPELLNECMVALFTSHCSHSVKNTFAMNLQGWERFVVEVLPPYLEYLNNLMAGTDDDDTVREVVMNITSIILKKQMPCKTGLDFMSWVKGPIDFTQILAKKKMAVSIPSYLENKVKEGINTDLSNMDDLFLALTCIPHVTPIKEKSLIPCFNKIIETLLNFLNDENIKIIDEEEMPAKKKGKKAPELLINLNMKNDVCLTSRKALFMLAHTVEAMAHIFENETFVEIVDKFALLDLLLNKQQYRDNAHMLRALDIYLTKVSSIENNSVLNEVNLKALYYVLAPVLMSTNPMSRLLAIHILTLFPVTLPLPPIESEEKVDSIFEIMLNAELISLTPFTFRDRLRLLELLEASQHLSHQPVCGTFFQAPMLMFIGQFYINYKDMWEPCIRFLTSHAQDMALNDFWPLWHMVLKITSYKTEQMLLGNTVDCDTDLQIDNEVIESVVQHLNHHPSYEKILKKSDHMHFRELLWKAMTRFPDVSEARSRDVVPLFLNFLHNELFPVDHNVAPTQDLTCKKMLENETDLEDKKRKKKANESEIESPNEMIITTEEGQEENGEDKNIDDENEEDEDNSEGEEEEADENTEEKENTDETVGDLDETAMDVSMDISTDKHHRKSEPKKRERYRKAPLKTLCIYLTVFSKFRNPRMVSQSKKLEEIFLDFLTHPANSVQKLSLDCIMTYNHDFLTPYQDHLYSFIDGKDFKTTMAHFSIDGEEKVVSDDHRKDLMPYLMRIMYGRMHSKTGAGTKGKKKIGLRKEIVLRYLAGAKENEFKTFLDLSFKVLLSHISGDALEVVKRSRENIDITKAVPLGRLHSALSTVHNMIGKVGNVLQDIVSMILKVILFIANTVTLLLEQRAAMGDRIVNHLKHLRQEAHRKLIAFFKRFQDYSWGESEMDAVFEAIVWPSLPRLPDEGISAPTTLLRLFQCWAYNPRYVNLFAKHHADEKSLTPMPFLIKLMNHAKCSQDTLGVSLDIVEKLITMEDYDPESEPMDDDENTPKAPLLCSPMITVDKPKARDGTTIPNFGTALLIPHVDGLLKCLKVILSKYARGQSVNPRDLNIITSLSQWVTQKELCDDLLNIIIPVIVKKQVKNMHKLPGLLEICSHLLPIVENCGKYYSPLVTKFSYFVERDTRTALCKTISAIGAADEQYQGLAIMCEDLNSWSTKYVDEVDFERRMAAFEKFKNHCLNAEDIDIKYCETMLYNNMFTIRHCEESALVDMASLSVKQMVDMLARLQASHPNDYRTVIYCLLGQIRYGLNINKEKARSDTILLLRDVLVKCHEHIGQVGDLFKLTCQVEEEGDFFFNMCHIQKHRRGRAINKLADKIKHGEFVPNTYISERFLLPMITTYFYKEEHIKDDHLITSSITCVGAFASALPWKSYQRMLRYYLLMLTKQDLKYLKTSIRVIESILDGFHEEVKVPPEDLEDGKIKPKKITTKELEKSEEQLNVTTNDDVEMEEDANAEMLEDTEANNESDYVVYHDLVNMFIPQLQTALGARTKADTEHKVNQSKRPEDEEIKRIPLALALIKLINKLPQSLKNANVNSILMKMISFLKSRAHSIRDEARNMLVKIMVELGGHYLPWLVRDMHSILTRGYQVHVLVYTLHAIMSELRPTLETKNIDSCLTEIVEICKDDILGVQAEQKEVREITDKLKEARVNKGYAILALAAEFISDKNLPEIIAPLKDVLSGTQDKKIVNKMSRCLFDIATGLERNETIQVKQKSIFIYGLLNERIKTLTEEQEKKPKKSKIQQINILIIEPEPKRARLAPKTSLNATVHVLTEFAVVLLFNLLRKAKFDPEVKEHTPLLDPYLKVLQKCIDSEYPEISINALKCVSFLIKFPLPSMKTELKNVCNQMFLILHKFTSAELAKGKVYELVQLSFKTLSLIIKSSDSYVMNEDELRILLEYLKEILNDRKQQQSGFMILQAVIARKIDAPELHDLMETVRTMSITCGGLNSLMQARTTFYTYFLTYPMETKAIVNHLNYYIDNIGYQMLDGRISASIMLNNIIANFPSRFFNKHFQTNVWYNFSEQLMKEEDTENRNLLQKGLKTLFKRSNQKERLVHLCANLLKEKKDESMESNMVAVQLACKGLTSFLDVPAQELPSSMLGTVMPKIIDLLDPTKYSKHLNSNNNQDGFEDVQMSKEVCHIDNMIYGLLDVFTKLLKSFIVHKNWNSLVGADTWKQLQGFLVYPHIHVRLSAGELVGNLLAAHPIEGQKSPPLAHTTKAARSLVLDLCDQLKTEPTAGLANIKQLSLSVVRNLIYLVRHSVKVSLVNNKQDRQDVKAEDDDDEEEDESNDNEDVDKKNDKPEDKPDIVASALWVLQHVSNVAYAELRQHGYKVTCVREALLNLIAGLVVVVGEDIKHQSLLEFVIRHLARELADPKLPEELTTKTNEVVALLKGSVGVELYSQLLTKAQRGLAAKKFERKAHDAQKRFTDPVFANKKRKKKQEASKRSKKLKLAEKKAKALSKSKKPLKLKDKAVMKQ